MNIGQIVTILKSGLTGIITRNDSGIFQVVTLLGTKWDCRIDGLAQASQADADQFTQDVEILAPHHADLTEAFSLITTATLDTLQACL